LFQLLKKLLHFFDTNHLVRTLLRNELLELTFKVSIRDSDVCLGFNGHFFDLVSENIFEVRRLFRSGLVVLIEIALQVRLQLLCLLILILNLVHHLAHSCKCWLAILTFASFSQELSFYDDVQSQVSLSDSLLALQISIVNFLSLGSLFLNLELVLFNTCPSSGMHVLQIWHKVNIASALSTDQHIVIT